MLNSCYGYILGILDIQMLTRKGVDEPFRGNIQKNKQYIYRHYPN